MSEADELLDIEQAAQFLNVSATSLRRWTNAGRLACLRVGRRRERRFRRADLLAFMEDQPAGGQAGTPRSNSPHPAHTVIDGVSYALGAHLCSLYASEVGRIKQVIGFLEDGLRPGTVCLYVARDRPRADALAQLEKRRPSLRADIAAGRLILPDFMPSPRAQLEYFEASMRAALRGGADTLRIVGDVSGLGPKTEEQGLLEFEAEFEEVIAKRFPLVTLCQYDVHQFSGVTILNTLKLHRDTFKYPVDRVLG